MNSQERLEQFKQDMRQKIIKWYDKQDLLNRELKKEIMKKDLEITILSKRIRSLWVMIISTNIGLKENKMTVKELKEFLSEIPSEQESDKVVVGLMHGWFPIDEIKKGVVDQSDFEVYDFEDNKDFKETLEFMKKPKGAFIFNCIDN